MSDTLPPLPEPHGWIYDGIPNMLLFNRGPLPQTTALVCSTAPVYSADQMRSYAAAALAAERERQHEQMRQLMSELIFDEPAAVAEPVAWREVLLFAEAALADIGDADREPGDDLAWCEARAAEALPRVREALMRTSAPAAPPQREPLTDEQIDAMYSASYRTRESDYATNWYWYERGIREAERAHGISAPKEQP